ncbi:hypothetical protein [Sorangium sp. So ce119]|uniref:hypothetical protein n=1 Tax=Sorangium sp. So ce119 TaxID=3133279 RepID=UPI003F61D543
MAATSFVLCHNHPSGDPTHRGGRRADERRRARRASHRRTPRRARHRHALRPLLLRVPPLRPVRSAAGPARRQPRSATAAVADIFLPTAKPSHHDDRRSHRRQGAHTPSP